MHPVAIAALVALASPAASSPTAPRPGAIELEDRPLRLAALAAGDGVEVLFLGDRGLDRFRLEGRRLLHTGRHSLSKKGLRPLVLDAATHGGSAKIAIVVGEDIQSADRGTDTRLHAFVLTAGRDGALSPASDDLDGWLRIAGDGTYVQRRGHGEPAGGPVRHVEEVRGRHVAAGETPWAGRWLLDATPFPGGSEALAWDRDRPIVVNVADGGRVPGGSIVGDLGKVEEPTLAIQLDRPLLRGIDREGRTRDTWIPLPRRVVMTADGAAYTVLRARSRSLSRKPSGQDAIVRLDWSDGSLAISRPFPGVDAFVLDFAIALRPDGRAVALLLVNEKEDGSGRAHLVVQEPEDRSR